MARKPRIEYPGAVYHVLARANWRERIFRKDGDYQAFVRCLREACERTGWIAHAYVVMGNHYHLLLETPEANLVAGMKWLQGTFTQQYNTAHRQSGHLFQGRYKALIMDPEEPEYFQTVSTYIHLNPARARLVDFKKGQGLAAYPWSSYGAYVKPSLRPPWLDVERVLAAFHLEDNRGGRQRYKTYMEERAQEAVDSKRKRGLEQEAKAIRRGWCLGGSAFRDRMMEYVEKAVAPRKRASYYGAERRLHDERAAQQMLQRGLKQLKLRRQELEGLGKNDARKVALAGWLKRHTMVNNTRISGWLFMGHEMNVSRAVKACRERSHREVSRWLRKLDVLECAD